MGTNWLVLLCMKGLFSKVRHFIWSFVELFYIAFLENKYVPSLPNTGVFAS
jgi:hypothetical protein